MTEENKSIDILGVKPIADSINTVTEGTVNGASAFLGCICLPAAEEFGLLLKDKVSSWRARNAITIANKAEKLLELQGGYKELSAHPRIIHSTIENGSWAEEKVMQGLWAGILASSCTKEGGGESNLILINLLTQLTTSQVKLLNHICEQSKVFQTEEGWIAAQTFKMEVEELTLVMNTMDLQQIDRELDHLRSLELIKTGFSSDSLIADVTPMPLSLHMYVKGKGFNGNPCEFFGAPIVSKEERTKLRKDEYGLG
ncbi:hypothetical protein L2737_20885 [Shewanella electrodiphila]|uniref:DUF4393 domain-containing protein n=1 Tax=Shewanella electrodiphila TaxID=934143 RepID=A0ABT0KV87_9GAMM|nr:hypothetical protein [Shewanella electrodiphila]MCL1047760.1 hypothetical protein [Shewanella electrodiphila]